MVFATTSTDVDRAPTVSVIFTVAGLIEDNRHVRDVERGEPSRRRRDLVITGQQVRETIETLPVTSHRRLDFRCNVRHGNRCIWHRRASRVGDVSNEVTTDSLPFEL